MRKPSQISGYANLPPVIAEASDSSSGLDPAVAGLRSAMKEGETTSRQYGGTARNKETWPGLICDSKWEPSHVAQSLTSLPLSEQWPSIFSPLIAGPMCADEGADGSAIRRACIGCVTIWRSAQIACALTRSPIF